MNLVDLDTFVRVAETGSMTAAAGQLGVPKSTVSRRVGRLEDALGLELLVRGARKVALTDHGRALADRSRDALRDIADVERSLTETATEPSGTLRVTAPIDIGRSRAGTDLFASFRARYPSVSLHVELTNRVVDLHEEGFDVALRPRALLSDSESLLGRRILRAPGGGLYATSRYLAAHGTPRRWRDLEAHTCITHTAAALRHLTRERKSGDSESVTVHAAIVVNDFGLVRSLTLADAGIGLLIAALETKALLASGELVRVLPSYSARTQELWVVWPRQRHTAPRIRAFLDHLDERAFAERLTNE